MTKCWTFFDKYVKAHILLQQATVSIFEMNGKYKHQILKWWEKQMEIL